MRSSLPFLLVLLVAVLLPAAVYSAGDGADSARDDVRDDGGLSVAQLPEKSADQPAAKGNAASDADDAAKPRQRRMPGVTPGREAAAMTFVKQHHPELAELLIYLKGSNRKEYQLAVRDLFRASERLAQIQERDAERYELELALWKMGSRIQLLSARLQMSQDEELVEQLRAALNEQIDLRLTILQRDRDRQSERLTKLDEQLERIASRRQQAVERELKKLIDASASKESQPPAQTSKKK